MGRTFSFKDVPSKPFHGWKLSSFTRGKRYSLRGTFVGAFHGEKTFHRAIEGGKKKDDDDDDDDGGNKNSAQEGWEGSLNQAVKSFPPGKGRIKVESDLPLPSSLLREAVTTRKRSRIPVEK